MKEWSWRYSVEEVIAKYWPRARWRRACPPGRSAFT